MAFSMPPPPSSRGPPTHPSSLTNIPQTTAPTVDASKSITVSSFRISTRKLPILNAQEIEAMSEKLGIAPPEMIFGNNLVSIEKLGRSSGRVAVVDDKEGKGKKEEEEEVLFKIEFNALDALDLVDKTGNDMLKVAYSREWQKQRETVHEGIKEVVKPFDWTYSTPYKGTVTTPSTTTTSSASFTTTTQPPLQFHPTETQIPLDRLRVPDPILFYDEVMLYEDELADNGMSILSVKIRVMPARLLLLARFYMRLDDVVFRIRDTRVFIEFADGTVLREHLEKEDSAERVKYKLAPYRDDIPAIMRDANQMAELLAIKSVMREKLIL